MDVETVDYLYISFCAISGGANALHFLQSAAHFAGAPCEPTVVRVLLFGLFHYHGVSQVKLNEYRQEAAPADGALEDGTTEQISRALLSNTDKEIIFDGLKKLYRKKVWQRE